MTSGAYFRTDEVADTVNPWASNAWRLLETVTDVAFQSAEAEAENPVTKTGLGVGKCHFCSVDFVELSIGAEVDVLDTITDIAIRQI
jgi:hypothetical protein